MSQLLSPVAARGAKDAKRGHAAGLRLGFLSAVLATAAVAASEPASPDSDAQSTEQRDRSALLVSDSKAGRNSPPSADGSADESEEDCE